MAGQERRVVADRLQAGVVHNLRRRRRMLAVMMVEGCIYWESDCTSHLKRDELGAVGHHVEVRADALVLGEHLHSQRLLTSFLKL